MKTINFEITGTEAKYADIFVGENIAGSTCVSSKCYGEAHLHIDGASMKKITYKLISKEYDILGFKDGMIIIVNKRIGEISVKKFDIRRKEENVIKICEAYESVYLNESCTKPAAGLI